MSSYNMVGRAMRANLVLRTGARKLSECGMFPLGKSCNFSVSRDRSWYCYAENADCENSTLKEVGNAYTLFTLADVIEECSTGIMLKDDKKVVVDGYVRQLIHETNFQKLAFDINYAEIVKTQKNVSHHHKTESEHFAHWCYGQHVTSIQDIDILESEIDNTQQSINAIGNSHPTSDRQLNSFYQKVENRTVILIGDSFLQQFMMFMKNVVNEVGGSCGDWKFLEFWGEVPEENCATTNKHDSFSPKYLECKNKQTRPCCPKLK